MKIHLITILSLVVITACNQSQQDENLPEEDITSNPKITVETDNKSNSKTYDITKVNTPEDINNLYDSLPDWVVDAGVFNGLFIGDGYMFDNRMNPLYLEADFNGDDKMDMAIPVINDNKELAGIAVVHGGNHDIFILGAGAFTGNGIGVNLDWCDLWKVNRERVNAPGIDATEDLILENPSIQIEKSEVGGGQIYWNGKEYAYFHQTC